MKLLHLSECYFPALEYGGPISRMLAIGHQLTDRDHELTVYTSNLLNPSRQLSNSTIERQIDQINVVYFHIIANYRWNAITPEILRYCYNQLNQFDLIHIFGYRNLLFTIVTYFAKIWKIPYVVEPLGSVEIAYQSFFKKRIFDRLFGQNFLHSAGHVIVSSDLEKSSVIESGVISEKISVIPNPIELPNLTDLRPRNLDRDLKTILFLGRIFPIKGVDLLISAIAKLKKKSTRLIIAGPIEDRDYFYQLQRQAKNLGDRVSFVGTIDEAQKSEIFAETDLLVLPSIFESFGNVAAEAIAHGVPVIVTEQCGIAPIISEKVGFVVERSAELIAIAIDRLFDNSDLYYRFVKNCISIREQFSVQKVTDQIEDIYFWIKTKLKGI